MSFSTEDINSAIEHQLDTWPMARENFFRLMESRRKPLRLGDLEAAAQLNPARIVSTGAKVDAATIKSRPCFLCSANRPAEQNVISWHTPVLSDWELLINPYPILPVHFTIAQKSHRPQGKIPIEMAAMAEEMPDLAIFYNGAHAGASAPDHQHAQAVLSSELPLLRLIESVHHQGDAGVLYSDKSKLNLPFHFISLIITPDTAGMERLRKVSMAYGINASDGEPDMGLLNAFFWIGKNGMLRVAIVPRRRHRPSCYGDSDADIMVSPGAIDMAGLMITPRNTDFDRINEEIAKRIYGEVAFADAIPEIIKEVFDELNH